MIKLWWLIRYFASPDRPNNSVFWLRDELNRGHLIEYLMNKIHFRENWISTLRRWYYTRLFKKWSAKSNLSEQARIHKQREDVSDIIDKAIKCQYLIVLGQGLIPSETVLGIDHKGREFLKPTYFFEAYLNEFPNIVKVILSMLGGGVALYIIQKVFKAFLI